MGKKGVRNGYIEGRMHILAAKRLVLSYCYYLICLCKPCLLLR